MSGEVNQTIDTLRLSDAQAAAIGESLDRSGVGRERSEIVSGADAEGAVGARMLPLVMEIQQAGGAMAQYRVIPRKLVADEIVLFHGFFLNVGTACVLTMETLDHERVRVDAVVRDCRHAQGRVHEVVLVFKQRVDPSHFVRAINKAAAASAGVGAGVPGGAANSAGGAIAEELVRTAERLVAVARAGGSAEARRAIEGRLRQLLAARS